MVSDEAEIGIEEGAQALAHDDPDAARLLLPEEPVVDEHHLRVGLRRALEELTRRGDPADELPHLWGADDLEPHRPVVGVGGQVEVLVRPRDDLVSVRHRRTT